jgi:hypothetical protein
MEKSADDSIKGLLDWLLWFPTFGGLPPVDIRDNSVLAGEINPNGYWMPKALDYAMKEWVKSVEPAETMEIAEGDDIICSIHRGIRKLRSLQCEPTVLYGNPKWREDMENSEWTVQLKDMPKIPKGLPPVEFENMPSFYSSPLIDYSDGLYLFNNRNAELYIAGSTCALWNVRPLTVHLIRKER